jgi:hypothetical protein
MARLALIWSVALIAACGSPKEGALASRGAGSAPAGPMCTIDSMSVAGIKLGMTLADSRTAIPGTKLERTTDGEGVALVGVMMDTTALVVLYAGEEDAGAPLDLTKRIESIETFHSSCRTADGIHPGSLVVDVERLLGKTTEIVLSEIESREFITFEHMPPRLTFRLDYSGEFADGERRTKRYRPDARIFSIAVSR